MIRINLLNQEREKTKRRAVTSVTFEGGTGQRITLACTLVLLAAGVGVAWWYWSLEKESSRIDDEMALAEQETQRLRTLILQVQQFDERKAQLQQRVSLIEQLRRGQSGPVHMLDEISRSMPDALWLTQMEQKGADLTIEGRCIALTSLTDFVGNLENSGWFKKPVEIVDSQMEQIQGAETTLFRFTLKARFAQPGA